MKIDQQWVQLFRDEASSDKTSAQGYTEVFFSEDSSLSVAIDITLGEAIGYELIDIPAASVTVERDGQTTTLEAVGETGC